MPHSPRAAANKRVYTPCYIKGLNRGASHRIAVTQFRICANVKVTYDDAFWLQAARRSAVVRIPGDRKCPKLGVAECRVSWRSLPQRFVVRLRLRLTRIKINFLRLTDYIRSIGQRSSGVPLFSFRCYMIVQLHYWIIRLSLMLLD